MVFLFIITIFLFFVVFISLFSKIKIQIKNFEFTSENEKHINNNYKIIIKLYLFGKIPILKSVINNEKLKKLKVSKRIKNIDLDRIELNHNFNENAINFFKNIKMQIENINLNMEIGTENAALTGIIIPIISTIIDIYLGRKVKDYKGQTFIIKPLYINKNLVNIAFSGIFEIKVIHIINIIYIAIGEKCFAPSVTQKFS